MIMFLASMPELGFVSLFSPTLLGLALPIGDRLNFFMRKM
jgi:hypothetical protein